MGRKTERKRGKGREEMRKRRKRSEGERGKRKKRERGKGIVKRKGRRKKGIRKGEVKGQGKEKRKGRQLAATPGTGSEAHTVLGTKAHPDMGLGLVTPARSQVGTWLENDSGRRWRPVGQGGDALGISATEK